MIKAILYDLDGVLVDAVDLHRKAFDAALSTISNESLTDEEHWRDFNGLPTKKKLEILVKQKRVLPAQVPFIERLKQELTIAGIEHGYDIDHQKTRLHHWVKMCNIKMACVTNSIKKSAELMLKKTGQLKYMDLLITNEDVASPKPSPEGYWSAMAQFGVTPGETIIVEDSPKGIEAARRTGAHLMIVKSAVFVNIDSIRSKLIESSFSSLWSTPMS
jgi:beta-phosphoglucomutase